MPWPATSVMMLEGTRTNCPWPLPALSWASSTLSIEAPPLGGDATAAAVCWVRPSASRRSGGDGLLLAAASGDQDAGRPAAATATRTPTTSELRRIVLRRSSRLAALRWPRPLGTRLTAGRGTTGGGTDGRHWRSPAPACARRRGGDGRRLRRPAAAAGPVRSAGLGSRADGRAPWRGVPRWRLMRCPGTSLASGCTARHRPGRGTTQAVTGPLARGSRSRRWP